jgi:hypothetical protein
LADWNVRMAAGISDSIDIPPTIVSIFDASDDRAGEDRCGELRI